MRKIDELKQDLTSLKDEVRSLMDENKVEEADAKMEEVRSLNKQIAIQEELDKEEERDLETKIEKKEVKKVEKENREKDTEAEYRNAFYKFIRNKKLDDQEERALSAGTGSTGGFTVPKSFKAKLIDKLEELNIMRKLATVIETDSDTDLPVVVTHGSAAWTAENGAYNESEDTFGQITIKAYKLTRIIKVSEELLQDSAFDLEDYLVNEFARSISKAEEAAFVNGDGVNKPTGVLVDATVGVTAASSSAVTAEEIIDLYYALPRAYRENAVFMANDSTVKAIRKLKDSNGDFLWTKGLNGEPDMLLGKPIYTSEFAPQFAVDAKVMAFGDFSYYQIADRKSRVFQRLNEKYADVGQVGFRGYERVDGVLTLAEAVQTLQMAAV